MTQDEIDRYWWPARENIIKMLGDALPDVGIPEYAGSIALAEILGVPYPEAEWVDCIELTDDLKRKLELLSSPHYQTIVAIMKARGVDGQTN